MTMKALQDQLDVAERALRSKGYYKQCDVSACNCGASWNHGGHAEQRLREISDALPYENGKTVLQRLINVLDDFNMTRSALAGKQELVNKLIADREDLRKELKTLNGTLQYAQQVSTQQVQEIRDLKAKQATEALAAPTHSVQPEAERHIDSCLTRVDACLSERYSGTCARCDHIRIFFGTEEEARRQAEKAGWKFSVFSNTEQEIVHCQHCVIAGQRV